MIHPYNFLLSGALLGGHVRAVFSLITVIFIICVVYTITSFKEMPLAILELKVNDFQTSSPNQENVGETFELNDDGQNYGTMENMNVRL